MGSIAQDEFRRIADLAAEWRRPLLVSHSKPDGDAIGSLMAMKAIVRALGGEATALLFEDLPARYTPVARSELFRVMGKDLRPAELKSFDAVIVLDTCTYSQLEPIAEWLRRKPAPILAVDHHRTRDDLADVYLIDESAAANCLIVYDWARAINLPIEVEAAQWLFVGIATDTGWFRHSNTDERVFAASADLVRAGVDSHRLYEALYLCENEPRVRLLGAAIESLELHAGGKLAMMILDQSDFSRTGASISDTEDIINEPLRIRSVIVSALLVAQADMVRASFRSRSPTDQVPDIDVARLAQTFGGGGHARAAGARIPSSLAEARARVLDAVERLF
jgi:phosphoesterase RecJ-like protein